MSNERALAEGARAWPFEEARRVAQRIDGKAPEKGHVLFETGYGPPGLPHIGTFGELARTNMVRQALQRLSAVSTRRVRFAGDMYGRQEETTEYLQLLK